MAKVNYDAPKGIRFNVLASDGNFHTEVDENTPGAVRRDYETSDGKAGVKFEHIARSIEGTIKELRLFDGDFGKSVQITLESEDEDPQNEVSIYLGADSPFGESFLKALPNLDTSKPISFEPYSFTNDQGKKVRGMNMVQDGEKVHSYYHKLNNKTKKYDPTNGYPEVPKEAKDWDREDWKLYFGQARKFLIGEFKQHELYTEEERSNETEEEEENTEEKSDEEALKDF